MPGDGATKVSTITPPKPLEHTNKKVIPNKMLSADKGKHKMLKKDTPPKLCKKVSGGNSVRKNKQDCQMKNQMYKGKKKVALEAKAHATLKGKQHIFAEQQVHRCG